MCGASPALFWRRATAYTYFQSVFEITNRKPEKRSPQEKMRLRSPLGTLRATSHGEKTARKAARTLALGPLIDLAGFRGARMFVGREQGVRGHD
jgi:hypothetical protein